MPGWLNWILLIWAAARTAAGVLAANFAVLFWVLWLPGLACVGAFIYFSRRNGDRSADRTSSK
jgi:hypothetical protein